MVTALIVDDNAAFRATLRQVLTSRFSFLHVVEAASIRDALARVGTLEPDIFFVELRLPDGSGLDLARLFARGYRSAAIGIVTSFDIPEYRLAAKEAGADHFIAKGSSTSAEVIAVVDSFLQGRTRALLVFENARLCRVAGDAISARWPGMIVVEAIDERDAFAKALTLRPSFALVSASLLRTGGSSLCAALRSSSPVAVVVAVRCGVAECGRQSSAHDLGAGHAVDWNEDLGAEVDTVLGPSAPWMRERRSPGTPATLQSPVAPVLELMPPNLRPQQLRADKKP